MNIFSQRQKALLTLCENQPIVLSAYTKMQFSGDMPSPFRQEATFYWLTGIQDPDWKLLIISKDERYVVAPDIDPVHALFNGGISLEEAAVVSGAKVISVDEFDTLYQEAAANAEKIYTLADDPHASHYDFALNPALTTQWESVCKTGKQADCRPMAQGLRAIKSTEEVASMKKAINSTTDAFEDVKHKLSSLTNEAQIEAEFTYAFAQKGQKHAYDPIVAAGEHACTLHYMLNNAKLPKNGLVLMDIGAYNSGYAADITRTYAVGTPSARAVAVHAAVEKAHLQIIALIKPGLPLSDYQMQSDEIMRQALRDLGLLTTDDDFRKYFPHAVSHGLGIDVHESLGGHGEFKPGMVLTVEPGIYIPEEGIGIRIEDDILVTETGNQNLSGHLPTGL